MRRWQSGLTPNHWLYEVWIDGERAPDAVAVFGAVAIVMRRDGDAYERDLLDRIKADQVEGLIELRRTNAECRDGARRCRNPVPPYLVVVRQTRQVLTIGESEAVDACLGRR